MFPNNCEFISFFISMKYTFFHVPVNIKNIIYYHVDNSKPL